MHQCPPVNLLIGASASPTTTAYLQVYQSDSLRPPCDFWSTTLRLSWNPPTPFPFVPNFRCVIIWFSHNAYQHPILPVFFFFHPVRQNLNLHAPSSALSLVQHPNTGVLRQSHHRKDLCNYKLNISCPESLPIFCLLIWGFYTPPTRNFPCTLHRKQMSADNKSLLFLIQMYQVLHMHPSHPFATRAASPSRIQDQRLPLCIGSRPLLLSWEPYPPLVTLSSFCIFKLSLRQVFKSLSLPHWGQKKSFSTLNSPLLLSDLRTTLTKISCHSH